ncbi:MAG TPA: SDR family NAD(P)-dependent oxidoreductase [Fibrobacteria bacterium]|nr:SDR family NAD(P)-dependent oxidoreductase [Fibrobacteria bacterium]
MSDLRPIALVTGASSGIGEAYARLLAREGHDLWLVARNRDRLEALALDLSASGVVSRIRIADLSDRRDLSDLAVQVRDEPRLSVLVHNAGFGVHGEVGEADPEKLQAMADVHVGATIALCSAAAPGMRERRGGSIVVVSSIAGMLQGSGSATYCATKAFELSFARSLALELRPSGVRVQALCPGYTRTRFHDTPEYAHWSRDSVPAFLWSTPEFVASESWRRLGRGVVCLPGVFNRLLGVVADAGLAGPLGRLRRRMRR